MLVLIALQTQAKHATTHHANATRTGHERERSGVACVELLWLEGETEGDLRKKTRRTRYDIPNLNMERPGAAGATNGSGENYVGRDDNDDEVDLDIKKIVWANDEESLNRLRRNDPGVTGLHISNGRPDGEIHYSWIDFENDGELIGANTHLRSFTLDAWALPGMKKQFI